MNTVARLDAVIDEALGQGTITGAVVLVYRHGEPLFRRAAGFADREAGRAVEFDTIFRLASVTKPIVAATALALVERGRLSLSDRVRTYLPWFQPRTPDGEVGDVTIHHLLTHTSGLAYDPRHENVSAERAICMGLTDTDLDFELNFVRHNDVPLVFRPGTAWAYSFATDILGAVIAEVHGGTLEDAVVTYVAGPLDMRDSRFHVTDRERLAVPYGDAKPLPIRMPDPWSATDEDGWVLRFSPNRIFNPRAFQSGGAGMAGTAEDLMRFFEMLRGDGCGILKPETVRSGLSNRIGDLERDDPGTKFGYFGSVIEDPALAGTPQSKGTVRWGGVYGLDWFIDREMGISSVSVTNNALEGCMGVYPDKIMRAIYAD